jgi:hypothetical protein
VEATSFDLIKSNGKGHLAPGGLITLSERSAGIANTK